MPKWQKYLLAKASKKSHNSQYTPRPDSIWKKIIRDVREFYRILFRLRFHYLDYKDTKGALNCVRIYLKELGISVSEPTMAMFTFFHQTHNALAISDCEDPFLILENFTSESKFKFLSHSV